MLVSRLKYGLFFPVLIIICTAPVFAQSIRESEPDSRTLVNRQGYNRLRYEFNAADPEFGRKQVGQQEFFTLDIAGFQKSNNPGRPQVPVYSRLIDITGTEIISIEISNLKTKRIYPGNRGFTGQLYPSQPSLTKNQDPQDIKFVQDKEFYRGNKPSENDTVSLVRLGTIRGRSMAQLLIKPVIYYPAANYFDLITSLEINISSKGTEKPVSITNTVFSPKGISSTKGLRDYEEGDVTPGFTLSPAGMIIVSDTTMKDQLKPLIDWKVRKGFKVTELYIGEAGLKRTFISIKDTLDKIWAAADEENPHPDFLLLGGDLDLIPESEGASFLSDMYYGEFDGNGDYLPDMYIGRLPASDTTDMKAMVKKILQYERFEFGDTISHFKRSMLFTGVDDNYEMYMNGHLNYANDNYLNPYNDIDNTIFHHESIKAIRDQNYDTVRTIFNEGVGFVNYTGHGSASTWVDTYITNTFPETMTNTNRYPVIISNACLTGLFSNTDNIGTAFVKAKDKGALAFIGSTVNTHWNEDYWWAIGLSALSEHPEYTEGELGFYDRLFHTHNEQPSDWYTSLGQIIHAGNMAVLASTSSFKQDYWEYYHLLGDPSIIPVIGEVSEFSVEVPDSVPRALKGLTITTDPFSYAAISHFDTLWDASAADMTGNAYLSIPDLAQKDSCLLVITGQNKIPYIKTLYFNEPDTAWLDILDIIPADTGGNGNDTADYGETLSLDIKIQNAGGQAASDVYMKLSSDNKYLSIEDPDLVYIGTVGMFSEIRLTDKFSIVIKDSIPDRTFAEFNLDLHYGQNVISRQFDIKLHAPDLIIGKLSVIDEVLGDGDMRPEPGEAVDIIIDIINGGSSSISGVLELLNISPFLTIADISNNTGILEPGDTVSVLFSGTIDPLTPDSENISFSTHLQCGQYEVSGNHKFIVGGSIEDFESGNFNTFPWNKDENYPWLVSSDHAYNNSFSAVSGLGHNDDSKESTLKIMLNMPLPDTLSFWYRVSSELYDADPVNWGDFFIFRINDTVKIKVSGDVEWKQAKYPLPEGVHTLEWVYEKDPNTYEGEDKAWLDMIKFPAVSFLQNDLSVDSLLSPSEPSKEYSNEQIIVKVRNLGRDTIYSLPMAYQVNNDLPVNETFMVEIRPGYSDTMIFSDLADLNEEGEYNIKIFLLNPDDNVLNDTIAKSVVSTAISDISINSSDFTIAPNPFTYQSKIISHIEAPDCRLSLYDNRGRKIWEQKSIYIFDGDEIVLSGASMASGLYILKIDTGTGIYMYKLIKNK